MRNLLACLTAALILAGCSSEQDAQTAALASKHSLAADNGINVVPSAAERGIGFASLPDRGTLLSYDRSVATRTMGAHTLHSIQLSEAHALNAALPGRSIKIQTPTGAVMDFAYERREESVDGNWTWVGRTRDGLDAILTFGKEGVFGRIGQKGSEALRITMANGRSWMVVTDPLKVRDGDLLNDGEDVLIPPTKVASAARTKQLASAALADGGSGAASSADTIDVAVGYTPTMVTKYGTATLAAQRIAYLMALTNQAYINSQITPRVRLVHTMQVNYIDNNDNEVALEALSGVTCTTSGCTSQTVPAELQPLRDAREQYGADLVSLIRPAVAPQQNGCGIAWLLGGGGFAIDSTDAPYGYSVISDGSDLDETDGNTYVCREDALAHEMGHNMGQQHNVEDSGGTSGTHSYSYGYREASTTGFYTIMAYRLPNSSQFGINYFGNPSVNYTDTGRATGTATADNARSMNQSMLAVAQFLAPVIPFGSKVHNDLNGDGRSDLVWFNTSSSSMAYWWMNNTTVLGTGLFPVGSTFRIAGTGDLDGDGRTDIIWRDNTTNYHYLWRSRGDGTFDTPFLGAVGPGWAVARTTDINGDGREDIVWENTGTGQMAYWLMNGATTTGTGVFSVGTAYRIVGAGDFDGDGRGDILWANSASGYLYLWRSRGDGTFDTPFVAAYGTTWNIAGITDINGDGRSDIVWEEPTQGLMAYWFMNGATVSSTGLKSVGTAYRIATTGDLNGDGRGDIVWANASTGYLYLWRSLGNGNFDTPFLASYSTAWSLIP